MSLFSEAHQVRLSLKMKLSVYSWYKSSVVLTDKQGYYVSIVVDQINNTVRKLIPPVMDGISIRVSE